MSTHKSSTITGTLAMKTVNWTKVLDEELATDIDDMDSVGDAKAQEKCRRMCVACDAEIQKAEELQLKRPRNSSGRTQRLRQAGVSIPAGIKKRSACGSCMKAKEWCKWLEVGLMTSRVATSPRGGEHKKQAKKVADDDNDNEIVILSGWKTKWQGGSEMLEEVTNQQWGELIQAVSLCMDIANGHLEWIASTSQSNSQKMQWHYMLMEGLVGQQQMLLSRLVEISGATGSEGAGEVIKDPEEPKELQEMQGEGLGGQDSDTEGVPGEVLEGELEDVLGNEPEDGTGAEDGAGEEGQQSKAKDKGKEKAL
ncbi:hypothetical protein ID866_10576 [Astraeus odoratus]|nr:hypothetical protein ID866_10576 [Astraeus odoratus]